MVAVLGRLQGRVLRVAASVLLGVGLLAGWGCGGAGDERAAVLRTVEQARQALVRRDAPAACRLLSRVGMTRIFMFQVDFAPEGTPVPTKRKGVPQTCTEIVLSVLALSAGALSGPFPPGLAQGRLDVVALQTGHAKVAVGVAPRSPDLDPVITLSKGANGWRIDDCSCVPHGY